MGLKHSTHLTRDVGSFLPFQKTLGEQGPIPLPRLMQTFMRRNITAFEEPVRLSEFGSEAVISDRSILFSANKLVRVWISFAPSR
jgi:hypothetical protein